MSRRSTVAAVALTFAAVTGTAHAQQTNPLNPTNMLWNTAINAATEADAKAAAESARAPAAEESSGHPFKWAFGIGIVAAGIVAARRVSKSQLEQHNREYRNDRQP